MIRETLRISLKRRQDMNKVYENDGYVLRLAEKEDAEEYFENNFLY